MAGKLGCADCQDLGGECEIAAIERGLDKPHWLK